MQITKIATIFLTITMLTATILLAKPRAAETFPISIYTEIQDPTTKKFNLIAEIDSPIKSDRVTIRWDIPYQLSIEDEEKTMLTSFEKGINKFSIPVKPLAASEKLNIGVSVQVFYADGDRTVSTYQIGKISVNENLEVLPRPSEYTTMKSLTNYLNWAYIALIISIGIFTILLIFKKLYTILRPTKPLVRTPQGSKILDEYAKYVAEHPTEIKRN